MTGRISHLLPWLLITLGCVVVVESLYFGVERFLLEPDAAERAESVSLPSPQTGGQAEGRKKPVANLSRILDRNLFGLQGEGTGPVEAASMAVAKPLETTTLDIVLMGTTHGPDGMTRAIILNKSDSRQKIYEPGDTVQHAIIKAVERGYVVLSVDGRDQLLDMSEAGKYASSGGAPTARAGRVVPTRQAVGRSGRANIPSDGSGATISRPVQPQQVKSPEGNDEQSEENTVESVEDTVSGEAPANTDGQNREATDDGQSANERNEEGSGDSPK